MKKILAVLLVLAMAMTLALPTLAAGSSQGATEGDSTINISGKYDNSANENLTPVVSADISWDSTTSTFKYTKPNPGVWNEKTHTYDGKTNGGWGDDKLPIVITNHSDVYIGVKVGFTQDSSHTGTIDGTFYTKNSDNAYKSIDESKLIILDTAVGKQVADADSKTLYLGIDGDAITTEGKIGTITVTISNATKTASTVDEFRAAADGSNSTGRVVTLMNDIDLGDTGISIYNDITIDLNGHKLTSSDNGETIRNINSNTVIKNGTVENTGSGYAVSTLYNESISIMDCTLKATEDVIQADLDTSEDDVVIKLHNVKIETTDATDLWFKLFPHDSYNGKFKIEISGDKDDEKGLVLPHEMTDTNSIYGIYAMNRGNNRMDMTSSSSYLTITAGTGYYKYFDPSDYATGSCSPENSGVTPIVGWYVQ